MYREYTYYRIQNTIENTLLNTLSEYTYLLLHIKKHYFIHFCCFVFSLLKALCILKKSANKTANLKVSMFMFSLNNCNAGSQMALGSVE